MQVTSQLEVLMMPVDDCECIQAIEFQVELEREFYQLQEYGKGSGKQVQKWENVENEALRMQIFLLR